mmetsp:Transcript_12991/g.43015  ORF Transcript_12991/g.43015 Transcript_12991/m.43015 type:complete len:93 (+) Transcript_12991:1863-2141(+)
MSTACVAQPKTPQNKTLNNRADTRVPKCSTAIATKTSPMRCAWTPKVLPATTTSAARTRKTYNQATKIPKIGSNNDGFNTKHVAVNASTTRK